MDGRCDFAPHARKSGTHKRNECITMPDDRRGNPERGYSDHEIGVVVIRALRKHWVG